MRALAALRQPDRDRQRLSVTEVLPALRHLEAQVRGRLYAAGYIAYEAAPAFDTALQVRSGSSLPLLWFGLYEHAEADRITCLALPDWSANLDRVTVAAHGHVE